MAREALSYNNGFDARCKALNDGSVTPLPSEAADNASLTLMLTTAGNLYDGLDNAITNRYGVPTAEPLSQTVAKVWESTAYLR